MEASKELASHNNNPSRQHVRRVTATMLSSDAALKVRPSHNNNVVMRRCTQATLNTATHALEPTARKWHSFIFI